MNRIQSLMIVGAALSAGAFLAAGTGCGGGSSGSGGGGTSSSTSTSTSTSSSSGASTGGSTTSSSSSTSTSTSSTSTSTSTSSSSTSTSSGAAPDCTAYCTAVQTACTAANAQYPSMDSCMAMCAAFPPGAATDMSGDSVGCRTYHAGAAAMGAAAATTHCPHAGPTGGDQDPKGTAGTCGEPCPAFCEAALKYCGSQFNNDMATCMTACQGFTADKASYSTADTSTNDMGCRFYHLSVASTGGANATTHCPHIVEASPVCTGQ